MKAAVLRGPYDLRVEEVPRPKVLPGHVVVKVKATAICGTDVGIYKGKVVPPRMPVIQGHESTGEVVEVGPGVTDLRVGDRVVLNSIIFCRRCPACYAGRVNLCPNGGLMGREVDGTFAEYVAVPDYNCIKIPDSISYEDGTSLIALATVFRSHDKIRINPGDTVAVIGQGAAGLLQTRLSVISGAEPVFAWSRSQWKLDIAERFGARVINAGQVDPVKAVKEATDGAGVDVAIESIGSSATLHQAMEVVRPGGTVLFFGIAPASLDDFNGYAMYYKELKIVGSRGMAPVDFHMGIKVVQSGKVDLHSLITHRFDLDHVKDALELVDKRPGDALRVVVRI
ncbi:MAG: alcohol dehydrogenase catalytic domain-containing protein [Deltaproteobacteria bacterium]|nr:alcohol dehydrogenase catalytic domain-containing protein [Deltaproteobacteria bacterium]